MSLVRRSLRKKISSVQYDEIPHGATYVPIYKPETDNSRLNRRYALSSAALGIGGGIIGRGGVKGSLLNTILGVSAGLALSELGHGSTRKRSRIGLNDYVTAMPWALDSLSDKDVQTMNSLVKGDEGEKSFRFFENLDESLGIRRMPESYKILS